MSMTTPFKFLDYGDYEAITIAGVKRLKDCIAVNATYEVVVYKSDIGGREFLIFKYYDPSDDEAVLPDHIWSRIFIGPAFGEGSEMLQHGLLCAPLVVINGHNEESVVEIQNDGIVAFEVNGDVKVGKKVYLWMKQHTTEEVFTTLGEEIIRQYRESLIGGGSAKDFLVVKPDTPNT